MYKPYNLKLLLFISILFCLASCKKGEGSEGAFPGSSLINIPINPKNLSNISLTDLVHRIDYIKLESSGESLVGSINKLLVYGGFYYILDKTKSIFCFSETGDFMYKIQKVGKGPGEYMSIYDIEINPFKQQIEVLDRAGRKVLCYDMDDGRYINEYSVDFMASHMTILDEGHLYIYTRGADFLQGRENLNFNLLKITREGKLAGKFRYSLLADEST